MSKKIAIVSGASSGLGREFVKLLLQEKCVHEIWAIARGRKKLERLKNTFGSKIRIFPMDLSCMESIHQLRMIFAQEHPTILYLINSAGFAKLCAYDGISLDESVNMVDLNCRSVVAMGLTCVPYMPKGSHILNIASQASFQPLPYLGLYSATKAFVRNYSRALHVELKEKSISVTAVCPGWMDTALFERAKANTRKAPTQFDGMAPPDKVARKAFCDAKHGHDMSIYGAYVKSCHLAAKLLPQRVMMNIWLKMQGL